MQNAQQKITDQDVRIWCEAVGADEATRAELLAELRAIRLDQARWKAQLRRGHQPVQQAIARSEQAATTIRVVETALMPGLLQTPDYARAMFTTMAALKGTPDDADAAVAARMLRQGALYDPAKRIELLVTEAALRSPIAPPEVMAAQCDRLLGLVGARTVRFGIIPLDVRLPFVPVAGWTILDDEVTVEVLHTEIVTRDPDDVAMYAGALDELWKLAVEGDEARALLTRLMEGMIGS